MKLETEFYKLPLLFDARRLAEEVLQFTEDDWRPHPQGHKGNSALPFVAVNGDPKNDGVKGPMQPTKHLARCPYIAQVLSSFKCVLGRTRLMRIAGEADATSHVDTNYYWMHHVRVHVPVITYPEVRFICNDKTVHMAAGETWIFDTWRMHNSINPMPTPRIHLVADTVGSPDFWDLIGNSEQPYGKQTKARVSPRLIPYQPGLNAQIVAESTNFPIVMSPEEQDGLVNGLFSDMEAAPSNPAADVRSLRALVAGFQQDWRAAWAKHRVEPSGWPVFESLLKRFQAGLNPLQGRMTLVNGTEAIELFMQALVRPALNPELAGKDGVITLKDESPDLYPQPKVPAVPAAPVAAAPAAPKSEFDRPVFIVSAPRAGSTFLFETLAKSPDFFTIGGESHQLVESVPTLSPAARNFDSNRLVASDASAETADMLRKKFFEQLRDRDNKPRSPDARGLRMLEKTPKNSLRIPFLNSVFPDARFIYLYRDPRENISSIIDAWRSSRFVTYPKLPGWDGKLAWSLLLIPGWRDLKNKPVPEIAAAQWATSNQLILDDLAQLAPERWCAVTYSDLLADLQGQVTRLCKFVGVKWDQTLSGPQPLSRHTLTAPAPDKWKKNAAELETVLPRVQPVVERIRDVVADFEPDAASQSSLQTASAVKNAIPQELKMDQPQPTNAAPSSTPAAGTAAAPAGKPAEISFKSVHTTTFPELLTQMKSSLMVSTYQAGKLITVRALDGVLNTHFRNFMSPMGMAGDGRRLALGTSSQIWEFRNQPDVTRKLEPPDRHDACYLPRSIHYTGDIRVHEIAWAGDELWIVNTRFSCLCTIDKPHSFVPRWRPKFVTALSPEDRCHLNGLAMINGKPRYVTALGKTDTAAGWRDNKANGGILIDVDSNEIVASGLSMPHSPRWYADKLWLLESGYGRLSTVDPKTGKTQTVAELPGFTRGLDFFGPYAFVGLSQVRETAVFSGIPITETQKERICGVYVVDVRSGQIVAFLKFEGTVQEIFAVLVLNGMRFPEIINDEEKVIGNSFVLPDEALKDVPRLS